MIKRRIAWRGWAPGTARLLIVIVAFWTGMTSARAQCRYPNGTKVEVVNPPRLAERLSSAATTKTEFETTQAFEQRRANALARVSLGTIVVSTAIDADHVRYDADRQRFIIDRYAWANTGTGFDRVFDAGNQYGVPSMSVLDEAHGLGLAVEEQSVGTYSASNAYGRTTMVTKVLRTRYAAFDRRRQPREQTWKYDVGQDGDGPGGGSRTPAIYLNVRADQAPALKPNLRFGVELTPRPPFIARGQDRFAPRIDRPTDIVEEISVFTGKIGCLIITDASGTVLRAVPPGY